MFVKTWPTIGVPSRLFCARLQNVKQQKALRARFWRTAYLLGFTLTVSFAFGLVVLESELAVGDQPLPSTIPFDLEKVAPSHVTLEATDWNGQPAVRMMSDSEGRWPGVTWHAEKILPAGKPFWSVEQSSVIAIDVRNVGTKPVEVCLRVDGDSPDESITQREAIPVGQSRTIKAMLQRELPEHIRGKLFGMRGNPAGISKINYPTPDRITTIVVFVTQQGREQTIEFSHLRGAGEVKDSIWFDANAQPFPMIDPLGQYRHTDWPGKTFSEADLPKQIALEDVDLRSHPSPKNWNRYGGYEKGPRLTATGRFRVQKHAGRWWLVDPDGCLFWSQGLDCVHTSNATTPISDREFYFTDLPDQDSPLFQFYGKGTWAPHGYYQDHSPYRTFNFTGANLYRKYGETWFESASELIHRRLRSWGINTIANWSDRKIYEMNRTAYVVTASSGGGPIQGSEGYWGKFPDPFSDEFQQATFRNVERMRDRILSPWCIGVFIDNELAWGNDTSLATATLVSPATQPAKQAFQQDLKAKYRSIERLNQSWKSKYKSWTDFLQRQDQPDQEKAGDDLRAFYSRLAVQYFKVCRDAVKRLSPDVLYLGCRFAWVNDSAVRAAGQYCDVIGFNRYQYSVADDTLPDGVDRPTIIGEFHFGALDRGMFHTGLKAVENQQERAEAYRDYLIGALKHPNWVGAHWFQYGDQATTGRGDGENYQIGFVDVCDNPYPEMIEAARQIGATMYSLRLNAKL